MKQSVLNNRNSFFSVIVLLLAISCTTETKTNTNKTKKQLTANKFIEVIKTEKESTQKGILTGHNYGTTYSFSYQFTINKNEVIWKNMGSAVPKKSYFVQILLMLNSFKKKVSLFKCFLVILR